MIANKHKRISTFVFIFNNKINKTLYQQKENTKIFTHWHFTLRVCDLLHVYFMCTFKPYAIFLQNKLIIDVMRRIYPNEISLKKGVWIEIGIKKMRKWEKKRKRDRERESNMNKQKCLAYHTWIYTCDTSVVSCFMITHFLASYKVCMYANILLSTLYNLHDVLHKSHKHFLSYLCAILSQFVCNFRVLFGIFLYCSNFLYPNLFLLCFKQNTNTNTNTLCGNFRIVLNP